MNSVLLVKQCYKNVHIEVTTNCGQYHIDNKIIIKNETTIACAVRKRDPYTDA